MSRFDSITSVGGLIPSDLISRVAAGDTDLPGIGPEAYDLVPGERLNDAVTRSWNRLETIWKSFRPALDGLPASEETATTFTRDRWLKPLFDELGFAGLPLAKAHDLDAKTYAISHQLGDTVPIHQLGARLAVDRRASGIKGAATTSPHGLVQEFLNRSDDHLWGVVTNGLVLRILRDNASLTRQAYVEFDLDSMFTGERYSDFVALWLTCHRTRFEGDPPEKCLLEQWSAEAATSGTRALDKLRDGVETAIASLGQGFLAHPRNTALRHVLDDPDGLSTTDYQRQLLRLVYRLLFLLVAESRDLLLDPKADKTTRDRYLEFYSLDRLRRLATVRRGTTHDDLWRAHQLVVCGLDRDGIPALGLAPLGSFLWSTDATPHLADAQLQNRHLLDAIRALTLVRDDESKVVRAVDYRNLGAEELGSIYESLLELHAQVDTNARTFGLATAAGNERKTTGSYYTPTSLITELLDSALDPVLDEAAKQPDPEKAILDLSVMDMAIGSGHFVIAAANRLAHRLATVRAGGIEPAPDQIRAALRDVIGSCVYGIDLNPMAVELCKVSLWLEAMEPGKPLSFLDHRIVCGNALLGATPRLLAEGIPDDAFKPLLGDEKSVVTSLKKRNKSERQGQLSLGLGGSVADLAKPLVAAHAAIDAIDDESLDAIAEKQRLYELLVASSDTERAKLAADAWCAAVVAPKAKGEPEITTDTVRRIGNDPSSVDPAIVERVRALAGEYRFLHLHLAFPDLFSVPEDLADADNERTGWSGGVSVVLGNPPWERVKLQEKEFFAERDPDVAAAPNAAARKRMIKALVDENPSLWDEFQAAARNAEGQSHCLRNSSRFPLCGRGDVNTYTVFAENMRDAIAPTGRVGVIVPSGIATDDTTKFFFQDIVDRKNLASLFDFENRKKIFQGIDSRIKFCLLTLTGDARPVDEAEFVFFALDTADLNDPERRFTLTPDDFALLNPNTRTCPIFRTRRDAEITKGIYRRVPVLVKEGPPEENPWGVKFSTMFHMSNDSHLFRTREQLENDGWELNGNIFVRGKDRYLPLYEAKMVHHFDHRWATYEQGGSSRDVAELEKADPSVVAEPRYWLPASDVAGAIEPGPSALIGWREVCRSTDARTLVAGPCPRVGVGHKFQLIVGAKPAASTLAVLSSVVVDYVARQKLGGTAMSYFVSKQLPVSIDPTPFEAYVAELSIVSWDMTSPDHRLPYQWDRTRRSSLRAELDARVSHEFGVDRSDLGYILDTFPIVKRKDEAEFGEYRTKRLILECYDRMAEAKASGIPYETMLDPPPADPSLCHPESTRPDWADLYLEL